MSELAEKTILLLRGGPGVGKSAIIRALASRVEKSTRLGFYTQPIFENNQRVGFSVCDFDGEAIRVADSS